MFRTTLIGTVIVAGCVIGGCKKGEPTSYQAVPPAASPPANNAAPVAGMEPSEVAGLWMGKVEDEVKSGKLADAASDLKILQALKGKMTPAQLQELDTLSKKIADQTNPTTMPTTMPSVPAIPPMH